MRALTLRDPAFLGSALAAFTPASLSGLRVWYNADSIAGADGSAVSAWNDSSPNGFNLSQATGSRQPTLRAANVNGHAAVEFDGSADLVQIDSVSMSPTTGEWTVFSVFNTDTASQDQMIVNSDNQSGSPRASLFHRIVGSEFRSVPNAALSVPSGVTIANSTWYVGEAWRSATQAQALVNGSGTAASALTGPGEPAIRIAVGAYGTDNGIYFDGKIAEVVGYSRALDSTDRGLVRSYLQAKYAI